MVEVLEKDKETQHPNSEVSKLRKFLRYWPVLIICIGCIWIGHVTGLVSRTSDVEKITSYIDSLPTPTPHLISQSCPQIEYCEKYYLGIDGNAWVKYESDFITFRGPSGANIHDNIKPWFIEDSSLILNSVGIDKEGPTQRHETEHYDGLSVYFVQLSKKGNTLKFLAEQEHRRESGYENSTVSELRSVTTGNTSGFMFDYNVYGGSSRYLLQKSEEDPNFLLIHDWTRDPSNQGFEAMVDEILASLAMH